MAGWALIRIQEGPPPDPLILLGSACRIPVGRLSTYNRAAEIPGGPRATLACGRRARVRGLAEGAQRFPRGFVEGLGKVHGQHGLRLPHQSLQHELVVGNEALDLVAVDHRRSRNPKAIEEPSAVSDVHFWLHG